MRIPLLVFVTLDPVPGSFSTPDSAKANIQGMLENLLPESYNPTVLDLTLNIRELADILIAEGTN